MKKLLLIVNPVSGQKVIEAKLPEIENILKKGKINYELIFTERRGHAKEIAYNALDNGFDTIVCAGGDGTLKETITGVLSAQTNNKLNIGYLPCGSTNDFANTLGLDSDPVTEINSILKENPMKIDAGVFGENDFFSYIASIGAFTDISYGASQDLKNIFGHFAYILEGIKDVGHIHPIQASIHANGVKYEGKYIFCSVSNTKSVAGIVKLKDNQVDLHDGQFEVILVKFPDNPIELTDILSGAVRSDFSCGMFDFFKTDEIEFEFTTDETHWSLDGEEVVSGSKIKIKAMHDGICMLK